MQWRLGPDTTLRTYCMVLGLLVVLTAADGVLGAVMFDKFTEVYAIYLNQATAMVYGVTSLSLLLCRRCSSNTGHSEDQGIAPVPNTPWYYLLAIGCFNGTANFFQVRSPL